MLYLVRKANYVLVKVTSLSVFLTEIIIKKKKKSTFYLSAGNGKTTYTASEAVKPNVRKVHETWTLASEVISTGKP